MTAAPLLRSHATVLVFGDAKEHGGTMRELLESLSCVVVASDSLHEALASVRRLGLAMLVVSPAAQLDDVRTLVEAIDRSVTLVVWTVDAQLRPVCLPPGLEPDLVWEFPMLADTLEATLDELRTARYYPQWLESRLGMWAKSALCSGFGANVEGGFCFRKTTRGLLEVVSALIPFAGLNASGRMIVSAAPGVLEAVFSQALGGVDEPGDRHLYGLAGELANLALGRAQRDFRSLKADFALGHPMLVSGGHFRLRYLTDRPSLVYRAQVADGPVFFELCIDRSPEIYTPDFDGSEDAETDDIVFL